FCTSNGKRYRLTNMPVICNRLPMYIDRMSMLTTLKISTSTSAVLTDELTALKTLSTLSISGDFVLIDQSLIIPTLKELSLTGMSLHTVDINMSIRSLGRLEQFTMYSCYLPRDYILDFSKCTVLS